MTTYIKKANRRLYALRQLKRSGVAACDIISVYCALVRPILEYASVVFANMPKYLSLAIERVQKRALAIVYAHMPYDAARLLTELPTLSERIIEACNKFISTLEESNPLYRLVQSSVVSTNTTYHLRSSPRSRLTKTNTDRFGSFFSHSYANQLF